MENKIMKPQFIKEIVLDPEIRSMDKEHIKEGIQEIREVLGEEIKFNIYGVCVLGHLLENLEKVVNK
jgi:hypothetical protein